jgi:hypothetical protein
VLTSSSESSVLVIPRDAIVTQGVQSHVIAARDGKAVIVPVVIDGEMGTEVIVSGDLKEGESIVVRGNEQLRGGEPLMVLNNQSSQATSAAKGG